MAMTEAVNCPSLPFNSAKIADTARNSEYESVLTAIVTAVRRRIFLPHLKTY